MNKLKIIIKNLLILLDKEKVIITKDYILLATDLEPDDISFIR